MVSKRFLLFFLPILFLVLTFVALKQNEERLFRVGCCQEINYAGEIDPEQTVGIFEGERVTVPSFVLAADNFVPRKVLGARSGEKKN